MLSPGGGDPSYFVWECSQLEILTLCYTEHDTRKYTCIAFRILSFHTLSDL